MRDITIKEVRQEWDYKIGFYISDIEQREKAWAQFKWDCKVAKLSIEEAYNYISKGRIKK